MTDILNTIAQVRKQIERRKHCHEIDSARKRVGTSSTPKMSAEEKEEFKKFREMVKKGEIKVEDWR